jgi:uncharacterized membrane protein YtjA (UPF0391 family)
LAPPPAVPRSFTGARLHRAAAQDGWLMLYWSIVFFIISIVAAIFGFGGVSSGAADIAKVLFFVFLVLFVVSLIFGRGRRV